MVQGLSKSFLLIPLFTVCFLSLACLGVGPNRSDQPITDPDEARALNSFFNQWDIEAKSGQWNLSGEPCSGAAIDSTNFENSAYNPFIKCDCSYTNGLLCHITHLKVYALNVVGPIPEELWTLTYLKNLNLAGNFLTGPLSPSIGSLARIQYLRVGTNALSGQLPKEMGQLTNLLSLSLGPNNFSGPLPAELGNLLLLERLYIDSSGVRGEIPPTYAQMQNLNTLWASDIKLTGMIPEFIGNWQKLKILLFV
ncbi:hypothetical protein TIFTF001_025623 [Ficus carica]|uniref:Uncharacterized protein n=1 Tax=Ficus carica TaxID=3494 RepID=A0AA88DED1_FICCA|nr:hypothetical protein TIFTF001_025623 [Ficus carica]